MAKRVIHWAPKGLYTLCGIGGFVRLADREEGITCVRCMKALIASRERNVRSIGKRLNADFACISLAWTAEECGHYLRNVIASAQGKRWFEIQHPFRVVRKGTAKRPSIPPSHRKRVLAVGKCAECGGTKCLTVDHIVPLSRGGFHGLSNYQCLCSTCNRRKSNHLEEGCHG